MVSMAELFAKYNADHQHPVNRALHLVGIPSIILSLGVMIANWRLGLGLFVGGWILQLVGHVFEGKKPSFLSNPAFLVVGPVYFAKKLVGRRSAG